MAWEHNTRKHLQPAFAATRGARFVRPRPLGGKPGHPSRLGARFTGPALHWCFVCAVWLALWALGAPVASRAESGPGYRVTSLVAPASGHAGFTLMAPTVTGVNFTNTLSDEHAAENQIRLNGSGLALGDLDGDGRCDLVLGALEGHLAVFRNLGGWQFTNVSAAAGLDLPGNYTTGLALVDVDGDDDLDLLLNGLGTGTRLFLNDGHGHFSEATETGLVRAFGATTCALADIDGDGLLDLYVANYRTNTIRSTGLALLNVGGRRMIPPEERGHLEMTPDGHVLEHGDPHFLYHNDGHGKFHPLAWTDGTFLDEDGQPLRAVPHDWGLSCAFRDLNGDGAPDLYVCNDFHSPDRLWLNDGHGRFRAAPRLSLRHTATFSMAVDFADVDRDGRDDLLVSDMTSRQRARRLMQIAGMEPYDYAMGRFDDRPQLDRTVLQWNRGDGTFAEVASYAGLENSEWNWSVLFLDVDLDGYEDLLATTGHMFDTQDLDAQARIAAKGPYPRSMIPKKLLMLPPLKQARLAFRNRGDLTFEECGQAWGFDQVGVGQGMALADLDNDGDLDLVVNNLNGAVGLYRNETSAPRLAVRLKGQPPNTAGIGARITLSGGPVTQSQEMMGGGRYLSCDDAMRVFAAGTAEARLQIEVVWRSGRRSVVPDAKANCLYEIEEPLTAPAPRQSPPVPSPWFADVSERLNHPHHEDPFDDFARQPLMPRRLSQLGPGACWFDLDGDGREDLIVGSGKGGQLAAFRNDGQGGFQRLDAPPWNQTVNRDQTTILGWHEPGGTNGLLVGSSNYEDGQASSGAVRLFQPGRSTAADVIAATPSSSGPLALADYDGDGQLDLFVGGRSVPGRYPEAAASGLYQWRGGEWVMDAANTSRLLEAGLVSGAVWTDLDGDGWPDLVLAREWGSSLLFHNDKGRLVQRNLPVEGDFLGSPGATLANLAGWWNGVTAGDFDGDGNLDLLLTNWGLNTAYRASRASPFRLYYGEWDESGAVGMLEASRDPLSGTDVPERDLAALAAALPLLHGRFPTFAAFGRATVADILGPAPSRHLEVTTLASLLLLNRTNRFVALPLPREAQFAPALAACVGDFDGDGTEDVFLSQNFFATQTKFPRCDAGRGLWLKGDGRGGLSAVPGQESGILVYGEQRGAALADYDGDGRIDLVVTENSGPTKLYRNVRGRPGLRVRLMGPPGNPDAVGAVLRLGAGNRLGPAREIHGGAGYWSQDGVVQVLSVPPGPARLWVRWPGGKETTTDLPPEANEITLTPDGQIQPRPPSR